MIAVSLSVSQSVTDKYVELPLQWVQGKTVQSLIKGWLLEFLLFSFLAITTSNLHQIQKVRSVLKSACSEDFKTVLTFDI